MWTRRYGVTFRDAGIRESNVELPSSGRYYENPVREHTITQQWRLLQPHSLRQTRGRFPNNFRKLESGYSRYLIYTKTPERKLTVGEKTKNIREASEERRIFITIRVTTNSLSLSEN